MTSIYRRKDKRWVAQYADAAGKQKYLYAAKRKDVKAKLDKALEDHKQGLKQDADKLTLSEYLEDWLSATTGTVAESSHALRKLYARKHIAPVLGHIKLRELDALTVQTFYQDKHSAGMLPQTVKRMHATLSKALSDAVKFKLVSTNIARDAERPKVTRTEIQALNSEQVANLFDAARGDRFECFYIVAVTCGWRAGENIGLQWGDIDFQTETLRVRRAIHNCKVKGLKSERSYRTIKLSRTALTALKKQRANRTGDRNGFTRRGRASIIRRPTTSTSGGIGSSRLRNCRSRPAYTHFAILVQRGWSHLERPSRLSRTYSGTTRKRACKCTSTVSHPCKWQQPSRWTRLYRPGRNLRRGILGHSKPH
jgi:integrase